MNLPCTFLVVISRYPPIVHHHHAMHPSTTQALTPCTAQLARQPNPKFNPHPTYTEQDYMILLLSRTYSLLVEMTQNIFMININILCIVKDKDHLKSNFCSLTPTKNFFLLTCQAVNTKFHVFVTQLLKIILSSPFCLIILIRNFHFSL